MGIGVRKGPAGVDDGQVSRLLLVAVLAFGVIASVWIVQSLWPPEPRTSIASAAEFDFESDDDSAAQEAEEQQALDQQQLDESMQAAEEQNEEAQQQAIQDQVQAQESDPQVIQDAQQG
jgi:cell division protein FtsN